MTPALNHRFNVPAFNPALLSNFLLALQRAPGAPFRLGTHNLERVRIVIVERDDPAMQFDDIEGDEDDDDLPELLPPVGRLSLIAPPRLIRGEILRAPDGTLYERFGNQVRPLSGLASGPRGEVLEVTTPTDSPSARRSPPARGSGEPGPESPPIAEPAASAESAAPASPAPVAPPVTPCRPLFAEPGQWRVLVFGDVRPFVNGQLQHPDRLRDSHRLPCHVQVYESNVAQPIPALVASIFGDDRKAGEFFPLHAAMLAPLMIGGQLPAPRPSGRTPQHDRSWLLVGERVVHVTVAHDPTIAAAPSRPTPAAAKPEPEPAPAAAAAPGPRAAVPEAFARAAAFACSREEAIIRIAGPEGLGARFRRLVHGNVPAGELRSWQVRLSGRSADEQLWAVPPPLGWRHDPAVRAWAEQSLALGGYALPAMLREWEIFWLRQAR